MAKTAKKEAATGATKEKKLPTKKIKKRRQVKKGPHGDTACRAGQRPRRMSASKARSSR